MMMPLVSIIIPAYNCQDFVEECLLSVQNQTYTNWECIVVDDGSEDSTAQCVERVASSDNRIALLKQQHCGLAATRNNAILNSHGSFILPVDADDRIAPFYVEKAVQHFELYPETKLVYGLVEFFGDESGLFNLPNYDYESLIWKNMIICSAMYRRADYDRIGGYDASMTNGLEDWSFWLSLLDRDSVVYRLDEVVYYYRKHGESLVSTALRNRSDIHAYIVRNHRSIYEPYTEQLIDLHSQLNDLSEHCKELEILFRQTITSPSYRLGFILTHPIKTLKQLLCRK